MATPTYKLSLFQFPSNGKVYPKSANIFSREEKIMSFNSLQTGKCIQSPMRSEYINIIDEFQFPSNGKVYPKGREWGPPHRNLRSFLSFNSLQTGKCIQSKAVERSLKELGVEFQFPSNGKVYPKAININLASSLDQSFNSLQTGKCIQRLRARIRRKNHTCFNSLQTGKCIQSVT